jgi:sodium-dependent dicarboxylate transporter 2/3/5
MTWGFIAMVVYFGIAYVVLSHMFPADVDRIEGADIFIKTKRDELGSWTRAQKNTLLAFIVAVTLWVLPGFMSIAFGSTDPTLKMYNRLFPEAIAAMAGALLLFLLPVNFKERQFTLKWSEAMQGIEWGTLILFGGGLAMGGMMYKTGLSQWVGDLIVSSMGGAPSEIAMVAIFSVMALLLSELTSHTAATNMIGPLAITAAISAGISPVPVSVGIALSASLGFMLPVSTPPNAIVYASGYIPITKMIKTGVYIDFIGIACQHHQCYTCGFKLFNQGLFKGLTTVKLLAVNADRFNAGLSCPFQRIGFLIRQYYGDFGRNLPRFNRIDDGLQICAAAGTKNT